MENNYVQVIRNFIVENKLIKFWDCSSLLPTPNRINLFISCRVDASEEFKSFKSDLISLALSETEEHWVLAIAGPNTPEAIEEIKRALFKY